MPKLSVVIPCYNEAESLPSLIERIKSSINRDDVEVILVNDGSSDNSAEVLAALVVGLPFLTVVTNTPNQGYGGAILAGLKEARGTYIGWMHGDLQTPFADALKALEEIERLGAPTDIYVKGLRRNRRLSDVFFTVGMSIFETLLLQKKLWDINAQPNIFHRSFFESWRNPPKDFSIDLYALYQARVKKLTVVRIPVFFPPREHGHSTWNFGLASKIKFIQRTVDFSLAIRFGKNIAPELIVITKYLIAGGFGVSIHLGLLYVFTDFFNINYLVSTSLALLIVFWISFFIQKYWTFKEISSRRIKRQAILYFIMHTGNFFANGALMYILVSILGVWYMLSQIIVSLGIAAVTFTLNKIYIFKHETS